MTCAYNFNLFMKGNCSLRPHFQISLSGLYIQVFLLFFLFFFCFLFFCFVFCFVCFFFCKSCIHFKTNQKLFSCLNVKIIKHNINFCRHILIHSPVCLLITTPLDGLLMHFLEYVLF